MKTQIVLSISEPAEMIVRSMYIDLLVRYPSIICLLQVNEFLRSPEKARSALISNRVTSFHTAFETSRQVLVQKVQNTRLGEVIE
jgi:hypothetical protein